MKSKPALSDINEINSMMAKQGLPTTHSLRFLQQPIIASFPDPPPWGELPESEIIHLLLGAEEIEPYRYSYPYSYWETYNIAYTVYGETQMNNNGISLTRSAGCLVFTDNRFPQNNTVTSRNGTQILFLTVNGIRVEEYYRTFCKGTNGSITLPANSDIPELMRDILRLQETYDDYTTPLLTSCKLTELLTKMLIAKISDSHYTNVPSHILEIQEEFNEHFTDNFQLEELARKYSIDKYRLVKEFKQYIGNTPVNYLINCRIRHSIDLLLHSFYTVKEITYLSGFQSENNYIKQFKKRIGMTPSEYRKADHSSTHSV